MAAKEKNIDKPQPEKYNEKLAIKGSFLDVFKVVKKDKERRAISELEKKVEALNAKEKKP